MNDYHTSLVLIDVYKRQVEQELTYQKLQIPSSDIYEAMGYKDSMPDGMAVSYTHLFLYGPIVLAASTGTEHLDGLYADDSRGGHIAHGKQIPLQEVPMPVSYTHLVQGIPGASGHTCRYG